jgi:hypothetical protein
MNGAMAEMNGAMEEAMVEQESPQTQIAPR